MITSAGPIIQVHLQVVSILFVESVYTYTPSANHTITNYTHHKVYHSMTYDTRPPQWESPIYHPLEHTI